MIVYIFLIQPFSDPLLNLIEVGNEIMLIIMVDCLLPFVDESRTTKDRMNLGWLYLSLLIISCLSGIIYSSFLAYRMIKEHAKST